MATNLVRDPVHDFVAFELEDSFDQLILDIVKLPAFQRLRRINQLGFTSYVYPGATHSRFSHSLGVLEIARRMLNELLKRYEDEIPIEDRQALLLAALLHDIGHSPLSHAFEKAAGLHHEEYSITILNEIKGLSEKLGDLNQRIQVFIQAGPKTDYLGHIISSQLDADRFDYLLRDNIMSGAQYGHYDLPWIVRCLRCDKDKNRLEVSHKGLLALEGYLQARYHMYRNVYYHKTVRAVDCLFRNIIKRVKDLIENGNKVNGCKELTKLLSGEDLTAEEYIILDDVKLLYAIGDWALYSPDKILSELCDDIINRRIFKAVIDICTEDPINPLEFAKCYSAVKSYFDKIENGQYYWYADEEVETPYRPYSPDDKDPKTSIYIQRKNEEPLEISRCSKTIQALTEDFLMQRIFVHYKYEEETKRLVEGILC